MSEAALNFGSRQASGDAELAGASPLAVNVLVDGKGAVRRRPGISSWSGFPSSIPDDSPVIGMYAFEDELYYVNEARRIRKVAPSTATTTALSTTTSTTLLAGTSRPVFAETPYRLVIAGGGAPQKIDSGETTAERLGGSPPSGSQVAYLSSRLFSDDDTSSATIGQIRFSGVGDGTLGEEYWDSLSYATAEADPDDVVAIRSNANELFAFGARSLQVFSPDPVGVIAPGRAKAIGLAAAHSVVRVDESFGILEAQRRFVVTDGRDYEDISGDIAATLDGITTVSDCWGFRYNSDQFDCLVWVLPSDGRSFAWQRGASWAQWHGWTDGIGHTLLPIRSHYFWPEENLHLVGLTSGQIAKFDTAAYTDLGSTIKAEALTGFESRGTDNFKQCNAVYLTFKCATSGAGTALLSWRDDLGAFCNPIRISLTGKHQVVQLRGLGRYRSRQWKLEFTDAAEFVLARATEDYSGGN